jgi:integrase
MAIRRRGKNAWYVTVDLPRDPLTGRRRRAFLTTPTKREAERGEARLKHEAATGIELEPGRLTLAQYLERWLDTMQPNLTPNTHKRYAEVLVNQVIPRLGAIQLSKLRPLHIQQLHTDLRTKGRMDGAGGLSPKTILQIHRILSESMKHAVGLQLITQNPCQLVRAPQVRRKEFATLTPDETRSLIAISETADSVYGDAIILAVHTGMRMGELLGLKWEDIDLDEGKLAVRRTLQHVPPNGFVFQQPKTPKSRRTVPLGATAIEALRRQRRRQVEERLLLGPDYSEPDLVFASGVGTPIFAGNIRRAFERLLELARCPRIRFHDLRHTHASLLLARGVHPKVVSERLGHASIVITLDTYSHLLPTMQEDAVREFDAWMAGRA